MSDIKFEYSNECDVEIHCLPFGLSGVYVKVRGTNIMGIGSTMGLLTGSSTGTIHYNDSGDLVNQKYKLFVNVDDSGELRIDFIKIVPLNVNNDEKLEDATGDINDEDFVPLAVFVGALPLGRPEEIEPFIGILSFEREQ